MSRLQFSGRWFDFRLVVSKECKPVLGIALGSCKSQPLRAFVFLSRAIDETDSPSYSRVGPHAALGPTMTLHSTWPPSMLL